MNDNVLPYHHLSAVPDSKDEGVPVHVAMIMDGNGRWANKRGLPRLAGHKKGMTAVRESIEGCIEQGIQVLTLYAFSSENWKRPADEVSGLMNLLRGYIRSELKKLHEEGVCLRFIGKKAALFEDIQELIREAEEKTKDNKTHQ